MTNTADLEQRLREERMKPEEIASGLHPRRRAAVQALNGKQFLRVHALKDTVGQMTAGVKVDEPRGYICLSDDPLFEFVMDEASNSRGDDFVFLSPLGKQVGRCLSTAPSE